MAGLSFKMSPSPAGQQWTGKQRDKTLSRLRLRFSSTIRVALALAVLQLAAAGLVRAATPTTKKRVTPAHTTPTHSSTAHSRKATKTTARSSHGKKSVAKARPRGQAAPDGDRTREIQTALIREHYLTGEPSGAWDNNTRDALTRFQADHGWQTKLVPDSRALIKLGLGPSHEGLLNPDTAAISPHEVGAENPQPGGASQ